jgi:hypothetical protein
MTRAVSAPHLTAPEAAFSCRWLLETPQGLVALPPMLERWDYETPVSLSVDMDIRILDLRKICGLADDDSLVTAIVWHATGTNLRDSCYVGACPPDGPVRVTLEGSRLGGTLNLEAQVALTKTGSGRRDGLAAVRPGSVLWRTKASLALEGEGPRFPTEVLDFACSSLGASEAAWYLQWEPSDLTSAGLGAIRLYLNQSHSLMAQLRDAPEATAETRTALDALKYDLVRALITGYLTNPDFVDDAVFETGSVGHIGVILANTYFPNETIASLRLLARDDPQKLDTRVQHAVRLWAAVAP